MPRTTVLSVATAVPEQVVTSDDVKNYFPHAFQLDSRRLAVMLSVVDNAQIRKRHTLYPIDYTIEPRSLEQITCEYKTHSIRLGRQVAACALEQARLTPADI